MWIFENFLLKWDPDFLRQTERRATLDPLNETFDKNIK